jgi:hypothetical protein
MQSANHVIPLFAAPVVSFAQTATDRIHQLRIPYCSIFGLDCQVVVGRLEGSLKWRFAHFQGELKTIERLTSIAICHVG